MHPEREAVLRELDDALELVQDAAVVGIGGSITHRHPMALVRGLIRRGVRDLTVVTPTGGLDVDLLIAAGAVRRVITSYVGAESIASTGPAFRAAVEAGSIELSELDEGGCMMGLRAAGHRLPFLPWRGGVGTSLPELFRGLVEFDDPLRGERLLAIPALELDVTLIHADRADVYGNAQILGTGEMDPLLAAAARTVIVQADRIVSNDEIRREPQQTRFWRDAAVVHAPWGTHPYSGGGLLADEAALREYVEVARTAAAGDRGPLDAYIERTVTSPRTQADYLEHVGIRRILELRAD